MYKIIIFKNDNLWMLINELIIDEMTILEVMIYRMIYEMAGNM